ncbi:hypothetical protein B9T31_06095 [Acinetobacter sp. ANC 4558]|uniref:alpha/beta hydrolase n=1 Tax=Acinetobacter sp. ANC 4558 TaxID=1977876 RepID=UPI000A34729F|nr:alpha/beta hydrolase [Acinetobacter sp. ANC 4558]OTG87176.1 hypothetical protein B9T31_06095 [Acinetobacter sp. ANC 4558]
MDLNENLTGHYNHKIAFENFVEILNNFQQKSQIFEFKNNYETFSYGIHDRQKIDKFRAKGTSKGSIIFIHGGFWQAGGKNDYSYIAETLINKDFDVYMVGYPLSPEYKIDKINESIQSALDFLTLDENLVKPVCLIGHSAGAHLAILSHQHPLVQSIVAISGLYYLEPLIETVPDEKLFINQLDYLNLSPGLTFSSLEKNIFICVGGNELPEFIAQSVLASEHWQLETSIIDNEDHFSILDHLFTNTNLVTDFIDTSH